MYPISHQPITCTSIHNPHPCTISSLQVFIVPYQNRREGKQLGILQSFALHSALRRAEMCVFSPRRFLLFSDHPAPPSSDTKKATYPPELSSGLPPLASHLRLYRLGATSGGEGGKSRRFKFSGIVYARVSEGERRERKSPDTKKSGGKTREPRPPWRTARDHGRRSPLRSLVFLSDWGTIVESGR